jgi:hypothetical protein
MQVTSSLDEVAPLCETFKNELLAAASSLVSSTTSKDEIASPPTWMTAQLPNIGN